VAEAKNSKSCSRKLLNVVRAIALKGGASGWATDADVWGLGSPYLNGKPVGSRAFAMRALWSASYSIAL